MLDRLEEAKLVERRRDPSDRRAWQIYLTPQAQPMIDELTQIAASFDADLAAAIDPAEHEVARKVLADLREALTAMDKARNELKRAS